MSDKMRDGFKGWAYKSGYDIDDAQESADDEKFFVCYDTEACWQAWQASRAALVVELPDEYKDRYLDKYQEGFNDAVESCRNRLEDLGLELE